MLPTARGREVVALAQGLVPEVEERLAALLGADRLGALHADLDTIRRTAWSDREDGTADAPRGAPVG